MELNDEQRRVLGDSVEVVSACPGAGKTRAIIARFLCALVTSMRALSSSAVVPARDFGGTPIAPKVYVLVGTDSYKLNTFQALAEDYRVSAEGLIVLAPTRKQAALLAGSVSTMFDKGYGDTGRLLVVLAQLRYGRLSRLRSGALSSFTGLILGMFDWASVQLDRGTVEEKFEHLGLQPEALRLCLSKLIRSSAGWSSKDDSKAAIQGAVTALIGRLTMHPVSSVTTKFPKPRDEDWRKWTAAGDATRVAIDHSHIHEVKGKQFPAVLLHVPHENRNGEDSGFTSWLADADSEARRVLYVGASRAERLLALSIAKTKKDDIISILERDGVSYGLRIEEV